MVGSLAADSQAYDKILYVSQEKLETVTKSIKSGKSVNIDNKVIDDLMVPDDIVLDKAVLVPIDISDEDVWGEIYDGHEDLVEKLGAKGVAEAVIEAAKAFETSKLNFKEAERPIPMSVGEWRKIAGDDETDDDEREEVAEGADEDDEEEGEEEDGDGDEEDEAEPSAKKQKTE